ncbi:MAG: hypothetical protein A3A33_03995 [Candidatus Yanofskybacteria bacterium RIFCSPLOWO2_01_FULL_49_25]|uniref:Zinc-binding domain-containing protein n=1 Tax=Candidatus Yanofskybacteria bacterium RIFCSPLOWO2_01_FULL_49_25 TaxID=1802701 RepID=A0A1F8GS12_9BACT|nr:MAG: hypothetical protein A3A33_03995 [Candidatus Yanofskybacteria bacterium RIFCSPLOWO2_01_FULL_49_25]
MNLDQNTCRNCRQSFRIEPDHLAFYEKLQVLPPRLCPSCRFQRRYAWRNERNLYRQTCGLCQRSIITIYSPDKPFTVYCSECYHGDGWDPLSYGRDVDFTRPFLEQFRELQLQVPRLYAFVFQNANSEYTNGSAYNKNCYLLFVSDYNQDSAYSYGTNHSIGVIDCYGCNECELCYESLDCTKCYQVLFSQDCSDSQNLMFCKNCANCSDCIGSVNLRNKKYHIFNKPYTKEEYHAKIKELGLDTHTGIEAFRQEFNSLASRFINKYYHGFQNQHVAGDYISNSKNSSYVFDCTAVEDSSFINHGHKAIHCYDGYVVVDQSQYSYEIVSAIAVNNVKFGYCVWHDSDSEYCDTCENCTNIFGCIGLRKQSYCILNKQYSREEYMALVPKIIEHMKATGEYGEFFPIQLSPFAYNETVAQEYFPLGREEAESKGIPWKASEDRNYAITLESANIPNASKDIPATIEKEVIGCEHGGMCREGCTTAFIIISQELQYYQRMNLPLPRMCPNCRHGQRLKQRNPRKLWNRSCACTLQGHSHGSNECTATFATSYAPDRPERMYCEKCYQAEVM